MSHIQFTRDTRVELAAFLNAGKSQNECAQLLGMHRTTVCLEINRNKDADGVYRGARAHTRYLERRKEAKKKEKRIENDRKLRRHIIHKLRSYWSPEQIAGRLRRLRTQTLICHETIYSFIYTKRPDLVKYLRRQKNKYRRKRGTKARMERHKATKVRMIAERPEMVATHSRIGDWEDDTIVGKERTQRIWSCVERVSGFGMGEKLETVTAEIMHEKNVGRFRQIPKKKRLTLTRDNGPEFGDYDRTLEKKTGLEVYRANAYHSWERGANENWNGLLRQFFPKGSLFATITPCQVERAVRLLNNRPRKRLGYATPREVFKGCSDSD